MGPPDYSMGSEPLRDLIPLSGARITRGVLTTINYFNHTEFIYLYYRMKAFLCLVALLGAASARQVNIINRCGFNVWVSPLTNAQGPPLEGGKSHCGFNEIKI